jgi:hypothetical protein
MISVQITVKFWTYYSREEKELFKLNSDSQIRNSNAFQSEKISGYGYVFSAKNRAFRG